MNETANIFVTEHAYVRMRERLGLGKKSAARMAQRACERGIIEEDVTGRLSGYLKQGETHNGERSRKFLYGEYVFVFTAENGSL